jgi:CPA1 family monovalent cation:H+ antiporter
LLLESFIFLTMGLEMHTVLDEVRAEHGSIGGAVEIAALAFLMIIVVRSVFIAWSLWALRRRERRSDSTRVRIADAQDRLSQYGSHPPPVRPGSSAEEQAARMEQRTEQVQTRVTRALADLDYLADQRLGWREGVILVWAGMRGAVTLAAAQSLNRDIPQRAILVLIAFTVAAGTLLIQGGSLGWVARRLGLAHQSHPDDDTPAALRADLVGAASARLDDPELRRPDGQPFSAGTLAAARTVLDGIGRDGPAAETPAERAERRALRIQLLNAQRDELLRIRDLGTYPFGVLEDALNQIDADQVGLEMREKD